ncbi:MAG TPA: hypothetical protein VH518_16925 [Tepidisphaeraceae bacterium]|jgi:hypothetical protein
MPRDTRRSGLVLVLVGLLGAGFFWLTDPARGITGQAHSPDIVDAIRQAGPGTWVGISGAVVVALFGLWLMMRRTA